MSMIDVVHLTFGYDGSAENVFEDVSFRLDTDWRTGFTGRNGRGKTTFFNLLMGKYPYQGKISAGVDFEPFPYPVPDRSLCAWDLADTFCPGAEAWELLRETSRLGVPEEALFRPFDTLSGGEQVKVMLAGLFLRENGFLLIDEPTNHLDRDGREAVADYLRSKKGFILISHDRAFLDRCTDHTLSINRKDITVTKGNFSTWYAEKQHQDARELQQNEKLKKDIRRLTESARRAANWSDQVERTKKGSRNSGLRPDRGYIGHQAAKMMKRSKAIGDRREKAAAEKEKLLKNIEYTSSFRLPSLPNRQETLLRLEDATVTYGEQPLFEHLNFTVRRGERVALTGRNGSGKSTLLKILCGELTPSAGRLYTASGLVISRVEQDASGLAGSLADFIERAGVDPTLMRTLLRKFDFPRELFDRPMETYSAGQKKEVLLARSMCEPAHLYLWDEPLNYIDVIARMQIEQLLRENGSTAVFVEHDRMFCDNAATREFCLDGR